MPLWEDIRDALKKAHEEGREWLTAREIARDVQAVKPEAKDSTLNTIVRYYAINDPSKKHGASPIYLRNPLFVTDSPTTRGKRYRLLTDAEREAFLSDPREDLEQITYSELMSWLQSGPSSADRAQIRLRRIRDSESVIRNLTVWLAECRGDWERGASAVMAALNSTYWVHDMRGGGFAPATFLAYRDLDLEIYRQARKGLTSGDPFDDEFARKAIEEVVPGRFGLDQDLQEAFLNWSYGATGFDVTEFEEPHYQFLSLGLLQPQSVHTRSGEALASWSDAAFSSQLVVVRYPAPIALPYQRFCGSPAGVSRLLALVSATELLIRFLVAIAVADLFRCLGRTGVREFEHHAELEPLFSGFDLQLGHWVALLRELMRRLGEQDESAVPELVEVCQPDGRVLTLLGKIVTKRNKWIHPKGGINVSDERAIRECRKARPWLEEAIHRLGFLCDRPLGYIIRSRAKEGRYRLFSCMGTNPGEGFAFQTEAPLKEGVPFVALSSSRVLYLWPLLAQRVVSDSQQRSLYCFDRIEGKARCLSRIRLTALDQRDEVWEQELQPKGAADHSWLIKQLVELEGRSQLSIDFDLVSRLQNTSRQRQLVGKKLGPYSLEALVGRGGFGAIYQGLDPNTHMHVAIKVLDPGLKGREAYTRFQREFQKLKEVGGHPGIVRCFQSDSALVDGAEYDWYSMEFATGGDLAGRLRSRRYAEEGADRKTEMPWNDERKRQETVAAFQEVAEALAHLHSSQVVHRDIKPSNVLIMDDGSLRLADFGLVKSNAPGESLLTSAGAVLGTRVYMAPEQEQGREVDERADVYSLGVLLAEMATGFRPECSKIPERGSTLRGWRPMRMLPEDLREFLLRTTDLDPNERFTDAQEALAAFRGLSGSGSEPEARHWVLYWLPKTVDEHPTGRVDYAASNQFLRRGVSSGDIIWIVTVREGNLSLVGRLEVGLVTDRLGAEQELQQLELWDVDDATEPQQRELWDADHYAIAQEGTVSAVREIDLMDSLGVLEFVSAQRPSLDLGEGGRVNAQQLQTLRELSAASGARLQGLYSQHLLKGD